MIRPLLLAAPLAFSWASFSAASAAAASDEPLAPKQVAAPASDITSGRVRLPAPIATATHSPAWLVPVTWMRAPEGGVEAEWSLTIDVDGPVSFALFADSPLAPELRVVTNAGEQSLAEVFGVENVVTRTAEASDGPLRAWGVRHDVSHVPAGTWTVRARDEHAAFAPTEAWWVVRDERDVAISTWTTTLATLSDQEIGVAASLHEPAFAGMASTSPAATRYEAPNGTRRTRLSRASGELVIETERGVLRQALLDDGQHEDGVAGDGVFGARLPRWTSGDVRVRAELVGTTLAGQTVRRSVVMRFPVQERRWVLAGRADTRVEDDLHLAIDVAVEVLSPRAKAHVSAEVWGTSASGELIPVCWLSRMVPASETAATGTRPTRGDAASARDTSTTPEPTDASAHETPRASVPISSSASAASFPLAFDARWLAVAGASRPLFLRHVRVQDPDTHVVHDEADVIPLEVAQLPPAAGASGGVVTSAMLGAPATSSFVAGPPAPTAVSILGSAFPRHLMLVHGYCSSGSIWPATDFSAPKLEFLDPNQNRTHDQFALLLGGKMSLRNSFGVVGHSQGGPAALHLLTYYVSALDNATGGRRIQSVASPYQGTPLASLGSFACGVNNDMTPAGSTTWLAGIPTWARAEVYYWTTSDAGSACNFFTGLLLTNPEDGTVEQFRGQLPGANSMGHVTGWCHTTGMSYPANYTDHARNAQMNTNAAR